MDTSGARGERKLPPGLRRPGCDDPTVVAYLVAAGSTATGDTLPAAALSASAASMRGTVRIAQGQAAPAGGIPVTLGGRVQGRSSCDFTLADNPAAARVAAAGAAALAAKGVPVAASGRRPGEQRYLLSSTGFRDNLAYILYIVPDPASAQPSQGGPPGARTYTRNIYALAVVAEDGTVAYAAPLAP